MRVGWSLEAGPEANLPCRVKVRHMYPFYVAARGRACGRCVCIAVGQAEQGTVNLIQQQFTGLQISRHKLMLLFTRSCTGSYRTGRFP